MTGPAHAHALAHAPFFSTHAHGAQTEHKGAGHTLTASLTQRSRRSRSFTLTISPPFKGGNREQAVSGEEYQRPPLDPSLWPGVPRCKSCGYLTGPPGKDAVPRPALGAFCRCRRRG